MVKLNRNSWILWLILWPLFFVFTFLFFPPPENIQWIDLISLGMLMIIMSFFNFQVRGTDIVLLQGIAVAVFLLFGLFIEMTMMQVSVLTFFLIVRIKREDSYRIPVNSLMFLFVSLSSGLFYYTINGHIGLLNSSEMPPLLPIIAYSFMTFFTNHLFLYLFRQIVGKKGDFLGTDLLWEAIATTVIMPVGVVLYIIYSELGTLGIFVVAVPAISLSVIFRLVNSSYRTNKLLQTTSEIGQKLTESLDMQHIEALFFEQTALLFDPDFAYILRKNPENSLSLSRLYEKESGKLPNARKGIPEAISWRVGRLRKSYRASTRMTWRRAAKGFLPMSSESILSVPMIRNEQLIGVVTMVSNTKHAYRRSHLMVLQILANFLAVAIANAKDYQKTKEQSERCPLTNLYNYRYFMHLLEKQYDNQKENNVFSIIILDIDFFKKVNDSFGHESGNLILCQVAELLKKEIGKKGTVARYGGEEFIILLPGHNKESALQTAESIRRSISQETFIVNNLQGDNKVKKLIHITVSIGLATAREEGKDVPDLIRNADRAMYLGAKQKGRNRVATVVS